MKQMTSFFGGLETWRNLRVIGDFGGQLVIHNIEGPYKIKYARQGTTKEITVQPVTLQELQSRAAEIRKRSPVNTSQAPYNFQRIENNTGYLNFRSMQNQPVFEKFLDSVFSDIKSKPIAGLIIDLRQNGGGSSQLGEILIGYISEKPFKMGGGSSWKVSDEYKSFINEQAKTNPVYAGGSFKQYLSQKTGDTWRSIESNTHKAGRNNLRYNGKVCFLTGPNTFSSANMLANAIKDFQLATIIGEATGEPCNDFGELYWNKLPNTGLVFYTCSKQFIRANGDAKDPNPVLPDIEVKQGSNSLKDDVMEVAKKWVLK
jgi:C-terminal processing protease CtpA/Prc